VRRRFILFTSWFWSLVCTMGILYAGVLAEEWWWHEANGQFSFPMLVFSSLIILYLGLRLYRHKEVGHYGVPVSLPPGFWLWIVLSIVALVALVMLAGSLMQRFPQFFAG